MNLNHWADEAWAEGSWVPASWGGSTPIVIVTGGHSPGIPKKRRHHDAEDTAKLRKMLERLIDGPVLPELVEEAAEEIAEPTLEAVTEWVALADVPLKIEDEDEEELALMLALT